MSIYSEDSEEVDRRWRERPGTLTSIERYWMRLQPWLEESGYMLRPRYRPDWVPSWTGTTKDWERLEDGQITYWGAVMDATRLSDGTFVSLKRVNLTERPDEITLALMLSSEPLASDPRNHCVRVIEILQPPDDDNHKLLITPFLRPWSNPRLKTHGEAVGFFHQIFEGLQFIHEHHVAHRDCTLNNIMMDASAMYPNSFHPVDMKRNRNWKGNAKHYTRTRRPPRYYFIDYGLSHRYNPEDGPVLELPMRGGDKSAPEHADSNYNTPCDPFATDIYYLGNLIRERFIKRKYGFEFIEPLVADMVKEDPAKRPTIGEVVSRFAQIRSSLSTKQLRSRIVGRKEYTILRMYRFWTHWYRIVGYVVRRDPPIPEA